MSESLRASQSEIENPKSKINDLLRAAFLACSWTWVIGMFLPVLLVREYGVWAWVIFAVPNVVGAAAMGWTVASPAHSRQLVEAHGGACRLFSLVTLAFHAFFVCWLVVPWMSWRGWMPGVLVFVFALLTMRSSGVGLAAVLIYIYSLICAALFVSERGVAMVAPDPQATATLAWSLVALVPVCLFGFALNPYLDLTFHTARQASPHPRSARIAFGVGFGVLFLAMIVFTLGYSGVLWREILDSVAARQGRPPATQSTVWFIVGHILFQAAFTAGIHAASVTIDRGSMGRWIAVGVAIAVGIAAAWWAQRTVYRGGMLSGELVYRLFMSFYGLFFPAYAWLCILPSWRSPTRPSARQLAIFAAAVLLAAPLFWIAFIAQRMPWAMVGLAIVILARLAVASGRRAEVDRA